MKIKKEIIIIVFLVGLVFINGCFEQKPTIKQGIYGKITWTIGSCEPGSYSKWKGCTETIPLSVNIYIRELATKNDMSEKGNLTKIVNPITGDLTIDKENMVTFYGVPTYYLKNKTKLIKKIKSDENGFYEVELVPGVYSFFIEDKGNEICMNINKYDKACPIIVEEGIKENNMFEFKNIAY